ncbi:MAG TPA: SUMF1/EgtB/PvdO family nonheme iron enzyme [Polyangiaceae bacterium]
MRRGLVALSGCLAFVVAYAAVRTVRVQHERARVATQPAPAPLTATVPASALHAEPEPSAEPPPKQLPPLLDTDSRTLEEQRDALFTNMASQLGLGPAALSAIRHIFAASSRLGQGDPKITKHPMTRAACQAIRAQAVAALHPADARCGAPNMVTVFDPRKGETAGSAQLCMDQFEFPNIPCEYPVVWVSSKEADELCAAEGKRLCDAHEWEGACAGALHTPEEDYTFGERRIMQEYLHNKSRELIWAYGPKKDMSKCGTMSFKSKECYTPDWGICGSNTYPAGSFPECVSSFGVYDQHGNAAEHMNLPLTADELGKNGGIGQTEMKGSWWIFSREEAHPDDCRWRALMWHAGPIRAADSHRNYHLGFRCCKDIGGTAKPAVDAG